MFRERSIVALILGASLLAACGGGTPSTAPAGGTAAPTNGGGSATEPSNPTQGGGTANGDACAFLTAEEVAAVSSVSDITAAPVDATKQTCQYVSASGLPAVTVVILDPANTNMDVQSYLALPGSVIIPVNGAGAVFMPGAGYVLIVIKNGKAVSVAIGAPKGDDFQAAAEALAQKVADRL